ncbi:type I-F CRISPR-associated protein Csy3 (plasmid) [Chlorobium phaeovibrioides]|uniref:Type I-F CRISPR-associated protein Csy3 n=1 Tax=Chlorobium phaeovibrioides TaxID=1094 RepID=A0A5M8I527_CHLPH|nr:type I-F CRISPR-associated protein Csy3 [Chlorobium phaeovibrioides]KAA6230503.1 type I-F CRISPR-associated protein Csy3 [Chlorobium phaeovibrioides]
MADIKTASVLAFERKLDPSDALFFSGFWSDRRETINWKPLTVREKAIRGTISNRMKTKDTDPAKLDAAIENPNLQRVDVATLPNDADTLKVNFTLRIIGGAGEPSSCNDAAYRNRLSQIVKSYAAETGFAELSMRYAVNIANGRFLWRNRLGAESIEVIVRHKDGDNYREWLFDAFSFTLQSFTIPEQSKSDLSALSHAIEAGLSGDKYTLLDVTAFVRIGKGQEVYPSQELILDRGSSGKGQKSKTLYSIADQAAMHSQKIGNAIRTIDDWYQDEDAIGPIAVEPYGSVTSMGKAFRQPKQKKDFYTLLDSWVTRDKAPESDGDRHFVMATLVRGGVFGESGKE